MMTIKIKFADDEIITRINATLEEVAKYYFPAFRGKEVQEIEILEGGKLSENEYLAITATLLYRAPEWQIKEYQLAHNVRYCYAVEYKPEYKGRKVASGGVYQDYKASAGLCNV